MNDLAHVFTWRHCERSISKTTHSSKQDIHVLLFSFPFRILLAGAQWNPTPNTVCGYLFSRHTHRAASQATLEIHTIASPSRERAHLYTWPQRSFYDTRSTQFSIIQFMCSLDYTAKGISQKQLTYVITFIFCNFPHVIGHRVVELNA